MMRQFTREVKRGNRSGNERSFVALWQVGKLLKRADDFLLSGLGSLMATVPDLQVETALLQKIHGTFPEPLRKRYEELVAQRRDETLTDKDHAELLRLTAKVEKLQASRLEAMAELARLRHTSLSKLREELERSGWRQWLTN